MEPVVVFFIIFILTAICGLPLYLCLISASGVYIYLSPMLTPMAAMEKMLNATNSFPLLAVPFFIFAGQLMNRGGVTKRIFGFAQRCVGHLHGGLGHVNVLASLIFAGLSGSALADVGGLGTIEIKAMRDQGFDDDFTIGITGASSTVGPIIPPSVPFVIYGAIANVSIGGLFLGGVGPGIVLGIVLFIAVFLVAKRRNYPRSERATLKELWLSFKDAFFALCFPLIIIGGIWTGFFTPTEAALVSIIYGFLISIFIYKDLKLYEIPELIKETIRILVPAVPIVVGAGLFSWILTYERIDQVLVEAIFSITTNKVFILILINLLLLFMGMFVDVIAAIMILLPILTPLTAAVGVHPVHFGVMMVFNLMIGLLTPPVGESLYMLSMVADIPFPKVVRMVLPWMIPLLIALAIVTFVPEVVMFLPRTLGFIS